MCFAGNEVDLSLTPGAIAAGRNGSGGGLSGNNTSSSLGGAILRPKVRCPLTLLRARKLVTIISY